MVVAGNLSRRLSYMSLKMGSPHLIRAVVAAKYVSILTPKLTGGFNKGPTALLLGALSPQPPIRGASRPPFQTSRNLTSVYYYSGLKYWCIIIIHARGCVGRLLAAVLRRSGDGLCCRNGASFQSIPTTCLDGAPTGRRNRL